MWIFDKLFNRKIEGKSSLDDLAENVVVNKETNTTEIGGNLYVDGKITSGENNYLRISCNNYSNNQFTIPNDFTGLIVIDDLPSNASFYVNIGERVLFPPHPSLINEISSNVNSGSSNEFGFSPYSSLGHPIVDVYDNINQRFLYVSKHLVFIGFPINF